jgi:hypothetical protein
MASLLQLLQRGTEHGVPEPVSAPGDLVLLVLLGWALLMAVAMVWTFSHARSGR